MTFGPFEFEITEKATRVDFHALSDAVRSKISHDVKYNPTTHDIYSFSVVPRELLSFTKDLTRKQKKKSYVKVDRVLVQASPASDTVSILGIYPVTTDSKSGQKHLDLKCHLLFEVGIPGFAKFKIKPKIKNRIRSDVYEIFASRTDRFAQWIFLKDWVRSGAKFEMRILCSIPKVLEKEKRYITCDVEAKQKGRKIEGVCGKEVYCV